MNKKIDLLKTDCNKQKKLSYKSSSRIWKPWLWKPNQKNLSYESSLASWIRKTGLRKPKQKKLSYESSSQIRKPGLWKPKQKKLSYESSSQIRKLWLWKPKQKNPSHESSSWTRKPRWIKKTWQARWSQKQIPSGHADRRSCYEQQRKGFYTALVACAPDSQKFSCKNCAKTVLNQVSWQEEGWAYAAIAGSSSISSITWLEKYVESYLAHFQT